MLIIFTILNKVGFSDLQVAYGNRQGAILTPVVRNVATVVTNTAIYLDSVAGDTAMNQLGRINEVSIILLKIFNSIRGERYSPDQELLSKKDVILYISTLLCRTYFRVSLLMISDLNCC